MGSFGKRLTALESTQPAGAAIWHRILQGVGQSLDAAVDSYGRERIGGTDRLIERRLVDGQKHARGSAQ